MAAVLRDPALHAFMGGAPLDPAALQARYERLVAGSPDPDVAEVAWVVGTPWQSRGIATEAARALVAHLRGEGLAPTAGLCDGEVRWST